MKTHYFYLSETTVVRQAIETAQTLSRRADIRRVTGARSVNLRHLHAHRLAIAGRVVLHNASSAAAPGHLAAVHKRGSGAKNGAAA